MSHDKWLFTPGPLTTSRTVKGAQLRDLGSRDDEFIALVDDIRRRLLALAGSDVASKGYTTVLMQGSGTFGVESVISSVPRQDDKLLLIINGAYGRRIQQMCDIHRIAYTKLTYPENTVPNPNDIDAMISADWQISAVVMVHCETTTGILNPLAAIARVVNDRGLMLIVDAMSSFGAVPVDVAELGVTYLVSSSNKCIEGVPGFSFVIAEETALEKTQHNARSLSLDLYAQWRGLQTNGQFRFTPPVQSILAFHQALVELEAEGGVPGRASRYAQNHSTLSGRLQAMGFAPYLDAAVQGNIITTYHYPKDPAFDFDKFYEALSTLGFVIYPGKLTEADCFRVGNIGRLYPEQMDALADAIGEVLEEMNVTLKPVAPK